MPLMPLLPKSNWEFRFPPKCPLDSITFIQLKKFVNHEEQICKMGVGYDLIEESYKQRKIRMLALEE